MVALTLEQRLAEPVVGVRDHAVAWMFLQKSAKALLGKRIVLAQHISVGEVVLVLWRVARSHHHLGGGTGAIGIAWRWWRQRPGDARWCRAGDRRGRIARRRADRRQIKRRSGGAATGRTHIGW